ncbi:uncharacterized protein LOC131066901 isoform X2 [Cryptomeria japonica]|uniref:uncharacterized protein LOC131066901 isoform X2 n=1 Tax=Cryptomeria japonica TaxID=3369 RepID=UPI0027DA148E|nr:uncharacterized protein LOC131066901 isoform X2 [Cryptomeria japonica]
MEEAEVGVRVRTLGGENSIIKIGREETVKDLKARLLLHHANLTPNFHLYLRGSKLDVGAQMSSLLLQDSEFMVLIPFTKKQHPNDIGISGITSKLDIPANDYKQNLIGDNSDSISQLCCKGKISGTDISESSGKHTRAVADAAWHDIISDLDLLNTSSKFSPDVWCSANATKSVVGKRNELHDNQEGDGSRPVGLSLNSFRLNELRNVKQDKDSDRKRKKVKGINQDKSSAITENLTKNSGSACVEILDERSHALGEQVINSKTFLANDAQEVYSSRLSKLIRDTDVELRSLCGSLNKNLREEENAGKQREVLSYPPALQRPIKIFKILNTVYGFLEKQHMQTTWNNIKGALKQLFCHGFEEVTLKDIEQLAKLCPKVLVLSSRAVDGEDLTFFIDLLHSSRKGMHDQLNPLHDVIPGGKKVSERTIINTIQKRQRAFEKDLLEAIQYWQETKGSSDKAFDAVTVEDLILAAKDMDQVTTKNCIRGCASPPFPRTSQGHNKQYRCSETKELMPFDMVDHLKKGLGSCGQVVHVENINARKAKYGVPSITFSESTNALLKGMGISRLYSHQAEAIQAAVLGKNVVVATSTASGKSLCYNVPVLEELTTNPLSCALYLFPTKALAQDQHRALIEMTQRLEVTINMGIYDGDTSQGHRIWIRDNARLLITNPDMLHMSILPVHKKFERILSNLRFMIIDEAHIYKGVFGCHTALILRRMRRICHHLYGTNPTFIISSATAANPREHAMELANLREVEVVLEDGSPCGSKLFLLWNPPLIVNHKRKTQKGVKMHDPDNMNINVKRSSAIMEASFIFAELVQHGLRCIAFCNTRKLSELVLNYTHEILRETAPHLVNSICVYRAGYTVQDRRKIESDLFGGNVRGVAATNALELGIDVGNLDATLHLGFPGSVASLWQQAGRAGRREKPSLSIYVAFEGPLDQHFMRYPNKLFSRPIEHCQVVKQHLACAALEYPIHVEHDEKFFGSVLHDVIFDLTQRGYLSRCSNGVPNDESLHYIGQEKHPSYAISIRAIDPEKYSIINQSTDEVIEEIEESKAFFEVYEGAVYMHQGKTFLVKSLDLSAKIAVCQEADLKYYTKTRDFTDIHVIGGDLAYPLKISGPENRATTAQANLCKVTTKWIGFRRIWCRSNEVFDTVDLFLPEYSFESQAVWIRVPHQIRIDIEKQNLSFRAGLHAASHALLNIMPLYIMCNPSDLGTECANPHDSRYFPERLLLFDRHPGSIGIAPQAQPLFPELLQAALELLIQCECSAGTGCPNCVQNFSCGEYNEVIDKQAAICILKAVIQVEDLYREGLK